MENILPATLTEAVLHFANPENCRQFMTVLRWPDGKVKCPRCGSEKVQWLPNANVFKCYEKHDKNKFSLKVGTIFEDSPIGLDKWLPVMWMLVNCKNGVSSWEIHRALGVTLAWRWFMLQRGRLAMQDDTTGGKLGGDVEIDETFIGGKARNMHKDRKAKAQMRGGRNTGNKVTVLGMLERGGRVRAKVIADRQRKTIEPVIKEHVEAGQNLYADEHGRVWGSSDHDPETVNHQAHQYVNGQVHTNGIENFWSLLKRGLGGTYISVEPFHLFRYIDEQAFRYNFRKHADGEIMNDGERFAIVMSQIVGKRLTYKQLTGKEAGESEAF